MHVFASDKGVRAVLWSKDDLRPLRLREDEVVEDAAHPILEEAASQLDAYFKGERRVFDLELDALGTEFQRRAWLELRKIPYGETRTYGEQAKAIGRPRASRAVGAANGRNPLSIVVPCHRVVGANGALTGFAGGLSAKRFLLDLEAAAG